MHIQDEVELGFNMQLTNSEELYSLRFKNQSVFRADTAALPIKKFHFMFLVSCFLFHVSVPVALNFIVRFYSLNLMF